MIALTVNTIINESPGAPMRQRKTLKQKICDREWVMANRKKLPPVIRNRILAAEGLTSSPRCAALLRVILEQTTWDTDRWLFDGVIGVVALQAGCSPAQANRCVSRFVESGLLIPTKAANRCGKPKVYIVRKSGASEEPWPASWSAVIRDQELVEKCATMSARCATLLRVILEQATDGRFAGSIRAVATQTGCSAAQASRCVARFVESGLLTPTKASNGCGKPKVYVVRLPGHGTTL